MIYPHFKTAGEPSDFQPFFCFEKVKICLNIIKIRAFLHRREKFSATHCWSSWASSSSVCQTLSMMSQGLPRLAKREDGTWRKTGNIIFPSGLEIFSPKMEMLEKKTGNIVFHLTWKYFQQIYPSRHHNLPPTLETLIRNFPKKAETFKIFQKFQNFSNISNFPKFPLARGI